MTTPYAHHLQNVLSSFFDDGDGNLAPNVVYIYRKSSSAKSSSMSSRCRLKPTLRKHPLTLILPMSFQEPVSISVAVLTFIVLRFCSMSNSSRGTICSLDLAFTAFKPLDLEVVTKMCSLEGNSSAEKLSMVVVSHMLNSCVETSEFYCLSLPSFDQN